MLRGGLKSGKSKKSETVLLVREEPVGAMAKRTAGLDSAHQIGLSTSSKGKLMVVGECVMRGCKNWKN